MQDSTFIGLDVHKATISVAVAQGERGGEVRHLGTVAHRPDHVRRLVDKLAAGRTRLHFCYEAGPCGYPVGGRSHHQCRSISIFACQMSGRQQMTGSKSIRESADQNGA